ncbi:unnamed protein product [Mytilus coruscus]|uniref:Uncharacterized protein n=1 Tax=Mytilus coruscus TaxID=42192 RepID=A0A6J8E4J4_MYTCO|nr:unnamed protein product [Mytilus coruscus]
MVEVVRQIRPHVRPLVDLIKSKIATMRAKKAHMNGAVMNGMTENDIDRPKDETDIMIRKEEKKQTNSPNISMIPKLLILKNEVCIVLFKYRKHPSTIIVIIGNDEGSVKLPSHNLYNTNLHLINSIDMMQELAYNNLVFSVQHEMTSFHQTSHFRKTIETVLNARLNAQCRHLLKAD